MSFGGIISIIYKMFSLSLTQDKKKHRYQSKYFVERS